MAGTTLKLGYTNPLTDTFGAHPVLGAVIDLNDGVTFTLASPDGLEMPAPPRTLALAGNIRTQGEVATRSITRHNRTVTAQLFVGPAANVSTLLAALLELLQWLSAPPQLPITLQYQPFNGTAPVYLDVVGAAHNLPSDESQWLRGQFEPLTLTFTCRPGLRGDRVTLQNLLPNAGFEQPGGGLKSGAQVFNDSFATANFYSLKAGAAPTVGAVNNNYPDVVSADAPLRYFRMSEAAGTAMFDVSGSGQNGVYQAAPTLGVASPIFGDAADKAVTFNGTTQYATVPISGLPTGANAPVTLECWCKFAANPAADQYLVCLGDRRTAGAVLALIIGSTGNAKASTSTVVVTSAAVLSLNTWHHLAATYDGVTLRLYVDGALSNSAAASLTLAYVGGQPCTIAAITSGTGPVSPGSFFAGSVDEVAIYNSAPFTSRILAHFNAGNAGTGMGTTANTLTVAAGARVAFGSPAWGSIQSWSVRFRFTSGGTYRFYPHYTDANNYLRVRISATLLALDHVIGGVVNTLASITTTVASNVWYWLGVTQFPSAPGEVCDIQATLYTDGPTPGTQGAQSATTGPVPSSDAVTALSGQPQIEAVVTSVILGGPYTNVHTVSLFGPGGWQGFGATVDIASCAWEQNTANTYPNGPVTSFGCARIDAPPAGSFDTRWRIYGGGTPAGSFAIPCGVGQTLNASAWVKSSGLGAGALVQLVVREFDSNGALLRSGVAASLTGNQAAWVQLAGTYTTGASCAYVDLDCRAVDATAGSVNAIIWFDNALLWNQTQLPNQVTAGMPWCDLRAVNSPAQLVVSGLLGDLPAPAALALGTYVSSLPAGGALTVYVGRKAITNPNAQYVGFSFAAFSPLWTPQGFAQLDAGSYGGFTSVVTVNPGWNPRFTSMLTRDAVGVYHILARVKTAQTVPNLGNITLRAVTEQQTDAWYGLLSGTDLVGAWQGPYVSPFTQSNVWTLADAGQAILPPFPSGALSDPSQLNLIPRAQWSDTTPGGATGYTNWQALLPVDGSLLVATVNNPNNSVGAVTNSWLWTYADGLLLNRAGASDGPAWLYSLETSAQPNAGHAGGGPGTANSGQINVNSGADPALWLDPTQAGANLVMGVNQLVAVVSDQIGSVLPCYGEISYSPLYLEPR